MQEERERERELSSSTAFRTYSGLSVRAKTLPGGGEGGWVGRRKHVINLSATTTEKWQRDGGSERKRGGKRERGSVVVVVDNSRWRGGKKRGREWARYLLFRVPPRLSISCIRGTYDVIIRTHADAER